MFKKLLGLGLLCLFLSSCTCQQKSTRVDESKNFKVKLNPSEGPKDPLLNLDQERLKILSLVFEPLLSYSANSSGSSELVPVLLVELPTLSADQLTYNFKIKKVPFHSSPKLSKDRVVTSQDVIMSLLRGVMSEDTSNYGNLLTGIIEGLSSWSRSTESGEWYGKKLPSGIKITSESEFSIQLLRKYPDFLALLTLPAFSVQPFELLSSGKLTESLGTGPYRFIDSAVDGKAWDLSSISAAAKFNRVSISESLDVSAIRSSDYSSLNFMLASEILDPSTGDLIKMPEHSLQELQIRRLEMLIFNFKDPLVKSLNPDFRKALLAVLDTTGIMAQMYGRFSVISNQFIPPGVEGAFESHTSKGYSRQDAIKKIKKALAKKTLKVIYPQSAAYWIQKLRSDLEEVGPHFEFEAVEVGAYLQKIENGDFQIAPLSWEGDLPEATNFLQLYYNGSQNNAQNLSGYKSATFDKAFDKLSKLFPSPERKALAEEAHRLVLKDLPALPLGFKRDYVVLGKRASTLNTKAFGASALKEFLLAP